MARTLNFDLVKDAIENAKQLQNYDKLDYFQYILSEILVKVRMLITNGFISKRSGNILLRCAESLHFIIISVQN